MKSTYKEIIAHPLILGAIAFVVVVAIGSSIYYVSATQVPHSDISTSASSTVQSLTATGTVEPSQNPDLAFESGGRVTRVNVRVGQSVYAGQVLTSLDTATLSAQRAGAEAALAGQQAKLAQLEAGARQVDVAAKQTAITQAQVALQNTYTNAATTISQAYDKAFSGVTSNTDYLFNQPNSANPTLIFATSNNQASVSAVNTRAAAEAALSNLGTESATLSSDPTQVEDELASALSHLAAVRVYTDALLVALGSAIPTSSFSNAQVTTAQTTIGSLQSTINALTSSIQSAQQQIASGKLAVTQANNALSQTTAPATPEDIAAQQAQVAAAQAQIDSINAQIKNDIVVAPFSGTVASVHVKTGDTISPNTVAVSLNPESALQVIAYFTEIDITKVKVGASAAVTLDAYGASKEFASTVVSVDTAPSKTSDDDNAPTGYKATLQFTKSDPAITSGMSANITIPLN